MGPYIGSSHGAGDEDVPAKVVSEWNGKRLGLLGVCCFSAITCITCAVVEETLSAVLAFGLGILAFYTLQNKGLEDAPKHTEDLELTQVAKKEGVDLDTFLRDPESHTASKILVHALIKEYLRVVARLQQVDPKAAASEEEKGESAVEQYHLETEAIAIQIDESKCSKQTESTDVANGGSRKASYDSEFDEGQMIVEDEVDGLKLAKKEKKAKKEKSGDADKKEKKEKKKKRAIDEEEVEQEL